MTPELEKACAAVHDTEIARYTAVRLDWSKIRAVAQIMQSRYRTKSNSGWCFGNNEIALSDQECTTVIGRSEGRIQITVWTPFGSHQYILQTIEDALIHIYREDIQRVARESLDNPSY